MVEMNSTLDEVKGVWLTSNGYVIRKYVLGAAATLAVNKDSDTKNTVYLKNWSAGQFGIVLDGEAV